MELKTRSRFALVAISESFQAWVYLLRRVENLPLREVAKHGNVSPSRISKIQRAIETRKIPASLQQLLDKCNVKNWPYLFDHFWGPQIRAFHR